MTAPDQTLAGNALPVINMLWVEGGLGALERACMRSVLRQGHRLVLWHYQPLGRVPEGVELRDGSEVVARSRLFRHQPTGSWSLFSNLFRYELLRQGRGVWLDCDSYLVQPVRWNGGLLAGHDTDGMVASGVLAMPSESPMLGELIGYFSGKSIPPWLRLRWKLRFAIERALKGSFPIERMPWGYLGPNAVTAMVHKHGLLGGVLPAHVFHPWGWQEADIVFGPAQDVLQRIMPDTVSLHMYNQMIRARKHEPAPPGSFMQRLQEEGA